MKTPMEYISLQGRQAIERWQVVHHNGGAEIRNADGRLLVEIPAAVLTVENLVGRYEIRYPRESERELLVAATINLNRLTSELIASLDWNT